MRPACCSRKYNNGSFTVIDLPRLELSVCECYAVVKNEFDRLLPDVVASSKKARFDPTHDETLNARYE